MLSVRQLCQTHGLLRYSISRILPIILSPRVSVLDSHKLRHSWQHLPIFHPANIIHNPIYRLGEIDNQAVDFPNLKQTLQAFISPFNPWSEGTRIKTKTPQPPNPEYAVVLVWIPWYLPPLPELFSCSRESVKLIFCLMAKAQYINPCCTHNPAWIQNAPWIQNVAGSRANIHPGPPCHAKDSAAILKTAPGELTSAYLCLYFPTGRKLPTKAWEAQRKGAANLGLLPTYIIIW